MEFYLRLGGATCKAVRKLGEKKYRVLQKKNQGKNYKFFEVI
jgi:hypothetical protein